MEAPDFSGWATVNNLKCSDGLTILKDAFKHNHGKKVPLVWAHATDGPANVLGHVLLENRATGVYCHAYFNDTEQAQAAKIGVQHGDITALSIYANRLKKQGLNVQHGDIKEVSLVLAGANPGAIIDKVAIQHSDNSITELEDEGILYTGLTIKHGDEDDSEEQVEETGDDSEEQVEETENVTHAAETDDTEGEDMAKKLQDVIASLNEEQQTAVDYLLGEALKTSSAAHSDTGSDEDNEEENEQSEEDNSSSEEDSSANDNIKHDQEDTQMSKNLFENNSATGTKSGEFELSHDDMRGIFADAFQRDSLKKSVEAYALKHGIEDIDVLFPDAQSIQTTPEFLKRRTEWVAKVMDGTHHTPFARIKSLMADLTFDEARAKGYIKGNLKKEEFFRVSKRLTLPQTVYKKQKLDRDDIVDITDFDVVAWLKGEIRLMLEEEVARAILIGDGRSLGDEDKINPENIRPIYGDDELYVTTIFVDISAENSADSIVDAITLQRRHYRGSGSPDFFTSETILARLLTAKDTLGRRLYRDMSEVAQALRVKTIVPVEVFEGEPELIGIMVDLRDYNVGTNRGGGVTLFDDFDIDYNQYKYLMETRLSGALVKPKSAIVVKRTAADSALVTPTAPTQAGNTVTVPTITGVTYTAREEDGTPVTITTNELTLTSGNTPVTVEANPSTTAYHFANDAEDSWVFHFES